MLDWRIVGGTVFDGVAATPMTVDIGIQRGRLVLLPRNAPASSSSTINACGLVVAPGFIDPHGSTSWRHLLDGGDLPKLYQGITTELTGNCGTSEYPATSTAGYARLAAEARGYGIDINWQTATGFANALKRQGLGVNVILLVGLNRLLSDVDEAPALSRLDAAGELLDLELAGAASGLSSGLVYPPGMQLDEDDLTRLANRVSMQGGIHSVHLRNEREGLLDAVSEVLRIAERTHGKTLLSHLKAAERPNWGTLGAAVARITAARTRGVDVTYEAYPYTSVSTRLRTFLPPHLAVLDPKALPQTLAADDNRARTLRYMESRGMDFNEVHVVSRLFGAATRLSCDAVLRLGAASSLGDRLLNVLAADADAWIVYACMEQRDVDLALMTDWALVCSDSWSIPFNGSCVPPLSHPRTFGALARFVYEYALRTGRIELGEAIKRVTSLPATWLGLRGRGRIAAGMRADIVVFDPGTFRDCATIDEPTALAQGMKYVFVNGRPMIEAGVPRRGRRGGNVLRANTDALRKG